MIAICQPASAQWEAELPAIPRSGSLRRIDDIVNELLAGYALAGQAPAATDTRPEHLGLPAGVSPQVHGSPIEMSVVSER